MANINLGQVVAQAHRAHKGNPADNISNKNALLKRLAAKGKVVEHDGGRSIARNIEYAENGTFMYYSGYQLLDITPNDIVDAATFDWKYAATPITFSGSEKRNAQGETALYNLVDSKYGNAMRTMKNNTSTGIYSDGTGSSGLQFTGLQAAVADDPTTGTYGGIDSSVAANAFWRNIVVDASDEGAATSASTVLTYMNKLYNQLTRGDEAPDIIVQDLNHFSFFENALQANQRFTSDAKGSAGFGAYSFRPGTEVFLDNGSGIAASHTYMLNTDYLFWEVHKDANMEMLDARNPVNQDAEVIPLILQANLTCSNRSMQGVLKE